MISVMVIGAKGKMGRISVQALKADTRFDVVFEVSRGEDVKAMLSQVRPEVVLDFTLPDCVFQHARVIIESGARPVIGTSGLSLEQIDELKCLARTQKVGGIIVPNFSIGAVMMMKCAQQVARVLPDVHIVELHHDKKVDAPSGTARKTAELLSEVIDVDSAAPSVLAEHYQGVPIHSVRLPSLFAHQAVVFSGCGETLTIKHDASSRECMMPGVLLACEKVTGLTGLEYGLDMLLG